ncbi:MAG TPA: hypothetical protein VGI39_05695 [Polyangiaceae bacterium]|jgi:hypothetical protein
MILFAPAAVLVLVRLRCPTCGALQARARAAPEALCACRECKSLFSHADGVRAADPGAIWNMSQTAPAKRGTE